MAALPTASGASGAANDKDVEDWLRAQEKKDLLRFVTIGSVDDGKSTLIGRLLHDAHGLYQDQLDAVRRASVRGSTRGAESTSEIDFSLFTDGLLAEREQGITIDVAYRYFATDRRKFIIADTPGHVQYTRNMATGASTADVAVILVDARAGVLAQTRRHAHIAALLGIPHVIACVNKMDLVDFDQARFDAIAADLATIAAQLAIKKLHPIPVSALAGDNVVTPSTRTPWWSGGTLLDHLETLPVALFANAATGSAFRFPVQLVVRPHHGYRAFAGQIVSGTIKTGDTIAVLPSGKRTRVVGVDVAGHDVGVASAPMSIALRLEHEIDVSRGDMIVRANGAGAPEDHPHVATSFEAHLVWMSERLLDRGKTYLLKHTTRACRASIEVVMGISAETLEEKELTTAFGLNDIGRVIVRCRAPIFVDPYTTNRVTGAFILIDSVTNDTVAAGMIIGLEIEKRAARTADDDARSQVGEAERRDRLGQRGLVVLVRARTMTEALDLSFAIERSLFDQGLIGAVEQELKPAEAVARAGLIALVPNSTGSGSGTWSVNIAGEEIASSASDTDAVARELATAILARSTTT